MTTDARRLDVYLSLKDGFSQNIAKSERGLDRFRTSLRRASITLGAFSAAATLALRSWIAPSEVTRLSTLHLATALDAVGVDARTMAPKLEALFANLSKTSGGDIASIRDIFVDLLRELGNENIAEKLLPAAIALERLTGTKDSAALLAKALTGESGAVEELRKLSGIDLSLFNTTAERLKAVMDGLGPKLGETQGPLDSVSNSISNLKGALGKSFTEDAVGPLGALADVFNKLAENKELVKFGATFTAISVGILAIGGALAGIAYLSLAFPPVAALIALAIAIPAIIAGIQWLDNHAAAASAANQGKAGGFGADLPEFGSQADENATKQLLARLGIEGGDASKFGEDELRMLTQFAVSHPDAVAFRELLARIRRARTKQDTKEAGPPGDDNPWPPGPNPNPLPGQPPYEGPGVFPPQYGGGGATDRANVTYNITSYSDIDSERRALGLIDDLRRRGAT